MCVCVQRWAWCWDVDHGSIDYYVLSHKILMWGLLLHQWTSQSCHNIGSYFTGDVWVLFYIPHVNFSGLKRSLISNVRMSWCPWDLVSLSHSASHPLGLNGVEKRLFCLCFDLTKSNSFKMEINAAASLPMTFPLYIGNVDEWLCQLYDRDAD